MGASKHMAASKHTGDIQMYGGIWIPLSLTKHALFVLLMYRGHPNIIQTYWGASKHGVSKHTGGTQMYGGGQTYREAYGGIQR